MAVGDGDFSVYGLCLWTLGRQLGSIFNYWNLVRHVQQCVSYSKAQKCLLIILTAH